VLVLQRIQPTDNLRHALRNINDSLSVLRAGSRRGKDRPPETNPERHPAAQGLEHGHAEIA